MKNSTPSSLLLLLCLSAAHLPAFDANGSSITEFLTPSAQSLPQGLDVAPDGSVYYTETAAGKIVRQRGLNTSEYALPKGAAPNILKIAEDGIWFTDGGNAGIGLLNPNSGTVVEYPVPSGAAPYFLQIARDGSKWFSEPAGVGRLSPANVVTEWHLKLEKTDSHIEQISVDPSGYVWFAEQNYDGGGANGTNLVRRLDPATNTIRAYPVPTFGGTPAGVAATATGRIWVSEYFAGKLALLDPQVAAYTSTTVAPTSALSHLRNGGQSNPPQVPVKAAVTPVPPSRHYTTPIYTRGWVEYKIPTAGANAEDMRVGDDGRLYFEEDGGLLGTLTPETGMFAEFVIPSPNSGYYNIALGNGVLWFAEAGSFGPVKTKVGFLQQQPWE